MTPVFVGKLQRSTSGDIHIGSSVTIMSEYCAVFEAGNSMLIEDGLVILDGPGLFARRETLLEYQHELQAMLPNVQVEYELIWVVQRLESPGDYV